MATLYNLRFQAGIASQNWRKKFWANASKVKENIYLICNLHMVEEIILVPSYNSKITKKAKDCIGGMESPELYHMQSTKGVYI